jgi:hypothetical protein
MADCGVSISSVSLSGLTTEVTFLPQTGGTAVDLGNKVFPLVMLRIIITEHIIVTFHYMLTHIVYQY